MKRNDLRKEELKKNTKSGIRTWQTNKKEAVSASTSGCNADETFLEKKEIVLMSISILDNICRFHPLLIGKKQRFVG